jgi:hypothetical protein
MACPATLALLTAIVALSAGVELRAGQPAISPSQAPRRLSVSAQEPLRLTIPAWIEPTPKRFGVFTLTPPERRSEMIQVSLPIGEFTMRAAHAMRQAQYRRSEQRARKEVARALAHVPTQQ